MQYRYFVDLTTQVERLRAQLAARPDALSHRGLDLSHAFARQLYFSGAADDALYALWARGQGIAAPSDGAVAATATALLAQNWFGQAMPVRQRLRAALAPARLFAGRGGAPVRGTADASVPILLFAHSLRFARFLAPLADRLGKRCAYLMSAGDDPAREWAGENGHAVRLYHPARRQLRLSGEILSRYAPGLALLSEEIEAALAGSGARIVLVPEGNAPSDEVVAQVARRAGIAAICLQQGWSPLVHSGFRNMHYARMLTWGQGFADLLSPFNPGQVFEPVGNLNLPPRTDAPHTHGLGFFCQGPGGWTSLEDQARMIDLACMIARALPNLPVHVRSHPVSPFDAATITRLREIPNIRISDPAHQSFAQMMAAISVGVSIYSSSLLECAASGVVPMVFNITDMPGYVPDLAGMQAGLEAHALEEARDMLVSLLSEPRGTAGFGPGLAEFQSKFFAHRGSEALDAICAALDRLDH